MGSTYYSIHHHIVFSTKERCQIRAEIFVATVMIIRMYDSGTPSGCDSFFPLDPGVSQGSTPGYYLSSLRDEDGETREFMC